MREAAGATLGPGARLLAKPADAALPLTLYGNSHRLSPQVILGRNAVSDHNVELLQGTLDVLILKTLSWGPNHGYGVARWLQQVTSDVLQIEEGSLYPALHRMERKGWIESEWGLSENNRRAKFYRMTVDGQRHLRAEATSWDRFAQAVSTVLSWTPAPASTGA
jgi:PadR family transcriptional regulator, regulatory protein PadR